MFYDFYEAWTDPNPEDKKKYLGTWQPAGHGEDERDEESRS